MNSYSCKSTVVVYCLLMILCQGSTNVLRGNGISNRIYDKTELWQIPYKTIYYDVAPDLHSDKEIKASVVKAIDHMNRYTCLRWVQKLPWDQSVQNYIVFNSTALGSCSATKHQKGFGKHYVTLTELCYKLFRETNEYSVNIAPLHEMMHILGFKHEQQRPDRDCYITVAEHLIVNDNETRNQWWPLEHPDFVYDKFPYDYKSVMHYARYDVHANNPAVGALSSMNGTLSEYDSWRIATAYCGKPSYCQENRDHCDQIKEDMKTNPNCTRIDYKLLRRQLMDSTYKRKDRYYEDDEKEEEEDDDEDAPY